MNSFTLPTWARAAVRQEGLASPKGVAASAAVRASSSSPGILALHRVDADGRVRGRHEPARTRGRGLDEPELGDIEQPGRRHGRELQLFVQDGDGRDDQDDHASPYRGRDSAGAPAIVVAYGIGAGTVALAGQVITYTVTAAVAVSAGFPIFIELSGLTNPAAGVLHDRDRDQHGGSGGHRQRHHAGSRLRRQ